MADIDKELIEKVSQLSDNQLRQFMMLIEQRHRQIQSKELEYEWFKQKEQLRERKFRSNTAEGEMVTNLDDQQYRDMNTRLTNTEISASLQWDILSHVGIMPRAIPLTEKWKTLKISQQGLGRQEKVSIITGSKQQKSASSEDLIKKLFKSRKLEVEESGNK